MATRTTGVLIALVLLAACGGGNSSPQNGQDASAPAQTGRLQINGAGATFPNPISSFTWLLLYQEPEDKAQAKAMNEFLRWALTDGQAFATGLGYAPLPQNVVTRELDAIATIKVD